MPCPWRACWRSLRNRRRWDPEANQAPASRLATPGMILLSSRAVAASTPRSLRNLTLSPLTMPLGCASFGLSQTASSSSAFRRGILNSEELTLALECGLTSWRGCLSRAGSPGPSHASGYLGMGAVEGRSSPPASGCISGSCPRVRERDGEPGLRPAFGKPPMAGQSECGALPHV